MPANIEHLVVDTGAFINNVQLQDIGKNLYTTPEVVEEVRCKRQIRRLAILPYDLQVKDVDPEYVTIVTKFAKKTGDYLYLSATDIKILALTYQLEKEHVGISHLRTEPVVVKYVEPIDTKTPANTPGFYMPEGDVMESNSENKDDESTKEDDEDSDSNLQEVPDIEYQDSDDVLQQFSRLSCRNTPLDMDEVAKDGTGEGEEDEEEESDHDVEHDPCITDGDDAGWITPSSFKNRRGTGDTAADSETESATVACYTTDFSMQNILKQIGLNIVSMNGMLIKELRTFVLRCYGCFHITPQTTRIFCPKCGNKTLKRVSVSIDDEGKQHVHINFRRPLTGRGKKFPLPRPKGGKHAINPILCEDQRVPQQRLSKLALTKNNPLHPDYIAGSSPFVMRDVSSKSAMIQADKKSEIKYWMRRNPNEVVKRRRKK